MKTLLAIVALGGILAAGSVGYLITARSCPGGTTDSGEARPAAPAPGSAEVVALTERVGELERLIVGLRAEVARLSEDRQRTAVASPAGSESLEPAPVEGGAFTATQRQAIVEVIEADRIRREEEREAEEARRAEQRILDRAAAVARELGLGVADEKRLGDLMIAGAAKRDELFQAMREGDFGEDARTRMRESFTALRDSYQADLNSAFGADLAKQILERTDLGGGRRGGDFMGGGPGFGGDGGGRRRDAGGNGGPNATGGTGGAGGPGGPGGGGQ
jgi:hypothetical protein